MKKEGKTFFSSQSYQLCSISTAIAARLLFVTYIMCFFLICHIRRVPASVAFIKSSGARQGGGLGL